METTSIKWESYPRVVLIHDSDGKERGRRGRGERWDRHVLFVVTSKSWRRATFYRWYYPSSSWTTEERWWTVEPGWRTPKNTVNEVIDEVRLARSTWETFQGSNGAVLS